MEKDYRDGTINPGRGLNTSPDKIAGLGPFRLKQYAPGERVVLERNPYYWKVDTKGQKLPYLDEMTFFIVANTGCTSGPLPGRGCATDQRTDHNFAVLEPEQQARHYKLYDVGPGLEYNFLMFNLNDDTAGGPPEVARKQKWFRDARFRQASRRPSTAQPSSGWSIAIAASPCLPM